MSFSSLAKNDFTAIDCSYRWSLQYSHECSMEPFENTTVERSISKARPVKVFWNYWNISIRNFMVAWLRRMSKLFFCSPTNTWSSIWNNRVKISSSNNCNRSPSSYYQCSTNSNRYSRIFSFVDDLLCTSSRPSNRNHSMLVILLSIPLHTTKKTCQRINGTIVPLNFVDLHRVLVNSQRNSHLVTWSAVERVVHRLRRILDTCSFFIRRKCPVFTINTTPPFLSR